MCHSRNFYISHIYYQSTMYITIQVRRGDNLQPGGGIEGNENCFDYNN